MSKPAEFGFHLLAKLKQSLVSRDLFQRVANRIFFTDFGIHEKMLADTARVEAYYDAISKYVRPNDLVIDLGTGTGLLAFFAHQKSPKKVYAIDHSKIIDSARLLAESNHLSGVTFIGKYSKHIQLPEKVDVLVQEQMGSWLFNENMVECVLDLRDRLLKKGARILPNKFAFLIEPIQLKDECRVPLIWEQRIHGISYFCLRDGNQARAKPSVMIRPFEVDRFLCEPAPLLTFDLETMPDVASIPKTFHSHKTVSSAGRLDGFCLYFNAAFDDTISLDASPLRQGKSFTNWQVPLYRAESVSLKEGDEIDFTLDMPELKHYKSWHWDYQTRARAR